MNHHPKNNRTTHLPTMRLFAPLALVSLFGTLAQASAATLCVKQDGGGKCKCTISEAVSAASPGDTIEIWPGNYKEEVIIEKPLSLVAQNPKASPEIDATGLPNGIQINGISAAPGVGISNVTISGLSVHDANFEGILVINASNVTLVDNHVFRNNKALDISASMCPGIPGFETNEGDDCGEGIHLMAVSYSSVVRNEVDDNSGGILLSDETGTNHNNLIGDNFVHDNPFDCGITLASHGPATTIIPTATLPFGLYQNTINHNLSKHNGLQVPGAGAGVGIFAPFPGTQNSNNVVINNDIRDNGLPGVTMHNHAASPHAPPVNLDNNLIIGNRLSGNAADTADAATSGPTGINIYSVAPISGTVISQNTFDNEAIDVAFSAPQGAAQLLLNDFNTTGIGVQNLGLGSISATSNWWNCPAGPGAAGCATVVGPQVTFAPWLTAPF